MQGKGEAARQIGLRIKEARLSRGLSLRALAEKVGVSAQAISKYERGLDIPGSGVLLRLAEALGVKWEYFIRPRRVECLEPAYRKRSSLPAKELKAITTRAKEHLERYLEVEDLFPGEKAGEELPRLEAWTPEEAEDAAEELRRIWDLGLDPIENLVELLEDKGVKVIPVDTRDDRFDAMAFRTKDGTPVIAYNKNLPGDRQRFSIAHELGHLVLGLGSSPVEEKIANRFAGAFLVPRSVARRELGGSRRKLGFRELCLLKKKYGLSMQSWIVRAHEIGLLSERATEQMFRWFGKEGFRKKEPEPLPSEEPSRMERLVARALAEEIITKARAEELLGKPLREEGGACGAV
ncbi:helix-turn-helix domain protein [Ammonifex degensii KC4]|uniref:Helix-turn-helix domain protein n=1 Tax=Ammonifex degensii (strain DSM 10501 / KC4) TaxID=429009 RepID=C9RC56_AMMDK|nr:XRE family transcriptional regulator [Ammonifex degensii]ACX51833.1 helix-turn-helix domain protein [Ammonifex degensii KC4]